MSGAHRIVIDTSAIMSILRQEDDAAQMAQRITAASGTYISAVTQLEAFTVALARGEIGAQSLSAFLQQLSPEIVAFDATQSLLAVEAMRKYGKGRHPASLNFGDCCAYAAAKALGLPLLYKGQDFVQTDLASALA